MINSILLAIGSAIGLFLSKVIDYIFGRNKHKADMKKLNYETHRVGLEFVNELQNSNDFLTKKLDELLQDIVEVKIQNTELKIAISKLTAENEQLRIEVANLNSMFEAIATVA